MHDGLDRRWLAPMPRCRSVLGHADAASSPPRIAARMHGSHRQNSRGVPGPVPGRCSAPTMCNVCQRLRGTWGKQKRSRCWHERSRHTLWVLVLTTDYAIVSISEISIVSPRGSMGNGLIAWSPRKLSEAPRTFPDSVRYIVHVIWCFGCI